MVHDHGAAIGEYFADILKLELFQHTGSFKLRSMRDLAEAALACGVTAVSARNHAIAVAFAAQLLGTTAKVVMPKSANPFGVARCRSYSGEVVLVEDVQQPLPRRHALSAPITVKMVGGGRDAGDPTSVAPRPLLFSHRADAIGLWYTAPRRRTRCIP